VAPAPSRGGGGGGGAFATPLTGCGGDRAGVGGAGAVLARAGAAVAAGQGGDAGTHARLPPHGTPQVAKDMGLGMSEDDLRELIQESDGDRDFHISVNEFIRLMRGEV